jgi:hypothetical protein
VIQVEDAGITDAAPTEEPMPGGGNPSPPLLGAAPHPVPR